VSTTKVSEALARPARTAMQGSAGWVETEFIDAFIHHLNEQQYGILVVVLTVISGWIQVAVENYLGKAVLRRMPAQSVPVADEAPKDLS